MGFVLLGVRGGGAAGGREGPARSTPGLAHVPLTEVGDLRGEGGGAAAGWLSGQVGLGGQWVVGGPSRRVALGARRRGGRRGLAVDLHVLPQGAGVRVGLVAAADLAVVGLIGGVDVGVLLAVAAVGELPLTAVELALEGLLPCRDTATAPLPASVGDTESSLPAPPPPGEALLQGGLGGEQQGKASPSLLILLFPCSPDSRDAPEASDFPLGFLKVHSAAGGLQTRCPGPAATGPCLVCPLWRSARTRETFITALMTKPKQNPSMPSPARAGVCRLAHLLRNPFPIGPYVWGDNYFWGK